MRGFMCASCTCGTGSLTPVGCAMSSRGGQAPEVRPSRSMLPEIVVDHTLSLAKLSGNQQLPGADRARGKTAPLAELLSVDVIQVSWPARLQNEWLVSKSVASWKLPRTGLTFWSEPRHTADQGVPMSSFQRTWPSISAAEKALSDARHPENATTDV